MLGVAVPKGLANRPPAPAELLTGAGVPKKPPEDGELAAKAPPRLKSPASKFTFSLAQGSTLR